MAKRRVKDMPLRQRKAVMAKLKNRVYVHSYERQSAEEQRRLGREIAKKTGGIAGATIGTDLVGPPGAVPGKTIGEYTAEKIYDEFDPPKKAKKSKR